MDAVALVVSVIALVVALIAWRQSGRSRRHPPADHPQGTHPADDDAQATPSASTGAPAHPPSTGAQPAPPSGQARPGTPPAERSGQASTTKPGHPDAEAARGERVTFHLEQRGGTTYRLHNRGTGTAYAVKLKAHRLGKNASYDEFPAGHAEEHELHPTDDPEKNIIEVVWHARPDRSDLEHHKLLRVT
ncbi:hypothetical protein [Phytoactinopolyspora limicola]|uniref:hypothetical protein n=1 Tax=Phytoactinopolyspora limicola TaxID=2715536 RepID=UPI00140E7CDA|nr:hypothetical protein [Phytoactinopolyspora limicola]